MHAVHWRHKRHKHRSHLESYLICWHESLHWVWPVYCLPATVTAGCLTIQTYLCLRDLFLVCWWEWKLWHLLSCDIYSLSTRGLLCMWTKWRVPFTPDFDKQFLVVFIKCAGAENKATWILGRAKPTTTLDWKQHITFIHTLMNVYALSMPKVQVLQYNYTLDGSQPSKQNSKQHELIALNVLSRRYFCVCV